MSRLILATAAVVLVTASTSVAEEGNADRGSEFFQRACAVCHSMESGRNMTGPSLAGVIGRKAGMASFPRYSPALKASNIVWDAQTLDPWLKDPAHFIPGSRMPFQGIADSQVRADIIAYLKQGMAQGQMPGGQMGGMMMGGQAVPNLKKLNPGERVQSVTYCGDTYRVTTADGITQEFWERNLRFKTDSGPDGPEKAAPAILGAGMAGDRASIIFSNPAEIGTFIVPRC